MFFNSIRWRLQLWYGLILLLILVGFGVTAYQLERASRYRRLDDDLHQRVAALISTLQQNSPGNENPGRPQGERPPPVEDDFMDGPPPHNGNPGGRMGGPRQLHLSARTAALFEENNPQGFYYVLWLRDGTMALKSTNAPSNLPRPNTKASLSGVKSGGDFREAYEATPPGECVLAGKSTAPEQSELRRFAWSMTAIGSVILLLGLAGGWWLASRAIRPIEKISATAAKISAGDLSQRIDIEDAETELGRLTGVLNSTFARLEAAFAQQGQFTADAAHELRTPVSVILLQVQMALKGERTSAEYRKTLEACQRSAQRMKTLVESLLELARLDAGQEPMKKTPFDLATVLGECADLLEPLAVLKSVNIQRQLTPTPFQGDPERMAQVFTNLLNNAIHYNREKGEVRITVGRQNGSAVVIVEDTGVGIGEDDLPKIFERFYRADKSRSNAEGHSGLGLAICKSVVAAHGGTIEATSQPGVGTQFLIKLPVG